MAVSSDRIDILLTTVSTQTMKHPADTMTPTTGVSNQVNKSYFWATDDRQGWNYTEYFSFFNDFDRSDENGKYSEMTIVSLLVLVSFIINFGLTCFFLFKHELRNHQHVYTMCLMLSSIIFLPVALMVGISRLSPFGWMYGMFGCQTVLFLILSTAFIKIWLMTLVSFDRYLKVNRQQKYHLGPKLVAALSVTAWIVPLIVLAVLVYPNSETKEIMMGYGNITICTVAFKWHPMLPQALLHFGGLFVFMYILPITIMIVCYSRIMVKLNKSAASLKKHSSVKFPSTPKTTAARTRSNIRKKRVTLILIAIMVIFFLMWTPLFVMLGWITLDMQSNTYYLSSRWIIGQICMLIMNTTIEPFLYSFTSNKVRTEIRRAIRRIFHTKPSNSITLDETSTVPSTES